MMRWQVHEMDKLQSLVVDTCDLFIALTVAAVTSDGIWWSNVCCVPDGDQEEEWEVCVCFSLCVCRLLSVLGEEGMCVCVCVWGGGPHCVCACVCVCVWGGGRGGGWRKRTGMKSVSIETDPNNPPKRQSTPPPRL